MTSPDEEPILSPNEGLDAESRLKVESQVEEYELKLRRRLDTSAPESFDRLERLTERFRKRMIQNELNDLHSDIGTIREEERVLLSWNLWISLGITAAVIVLAIAAGDLLGEVATRISGFLTHYLNWFYVLVTTGLLLFLLYLALSRFGNVVLGDPKARPEFSNLSWYSMLFSAGMGVGILFYGSAEPMSHFLNPPLAEAGSKEAARRAIALSVFHWGFHAWAVYTICAAAMAYYGFRKRKKYLISSSIFDITRTKASRQVVKTAVDMVSTLAVVFGVATSLGLGILQISSGLNQVFGIDTANTMGYLIIVGLMTVTFIISTCTGLEKGIKLLSNLNMTLAILLLFFVFAAGPTLLNLKLFVDSIGLYLQYLPEYSFKVEPFRESYQTWMGDWTLSYFTWWISWTPFVGIFVARISQGRTMRELIIGCLFVPTIFGILWFAVFGGTALHLEYFAGADIGQAMIADPAQGTFLLFEQLPLAELTSVLTILLLFTFLVTSADSATFVVSMMTSSGDLEPPLRTKVLWGCTLAAASLVLLAGGGMQALQASTLVFAFPFALVLILMAVSLHIRLSIQEKSDRL